MEEHTPLANAWKSMKERHISLSKSNAFAEFIKDHQWMSFEEQMERTEDWYKEQANTQAVALLEKREVEMQMLFKRLLVDEASVFDSSRSFSTFWYSR